MKLQRAEADTDAMLDTHQRDAPIAPIDHKHITSLLPSQTPFGHAVAITAIPAQTDTALR